MSELYTVIDTIKKELTEKNIRWKENDKELIITCPYCLQEGKHKLKLYISKDNLLWLCFRCGHKGNVITLQQVLRQYNLNLSINSVKTFIYDNFEQLLFHTGKSQYLTYKEFLSDEQEIKDTIKELQSNIKNLNAFLGENAKQLDFIRLDNKELIYYLQKRYIYTNILSLYTHNNIHIFEGVKDHVYGRLIFKGYLGTNFEARLYKEYLVAPKTYKYKSSIHDFFLIHNNSRKVLVIFEGAIDTLKAFTLIPNYNYLSLGGWKMYNRLFFFLKLLKVIYSKEYKDLIFIFDRDLDKQTIDIISNNIGSMYMSDFNNIKIVRFNFSIYKDVGEVPDNDFNQLTDYLLETTYIN